MERKFHGASGGNSKRAFYGTVMPTTPDDLADGDGDIDATLSRL